MEKSDIYSENMCLVDNVRVLLFLVSCWISGEKNYLGSLFVFIPFPHPTIKISSIFKIKRFGWKTSIEGDALWEK
jgi:hypothetical protein